MPTAETSQAKAGVHPHAYRMLVIAFINQNAAIACIWGSFSVLLTSVESRLGIGRELSTLGAPAVNLACAICAPVIGILAARYSLRLIMLAGPILGMAGYVLLAMTHSFAAYIIAYGLFLGPAMAVCAVTPATLVTRWFTTNAGKALGVVTTQIVVVFIPLTVTWTVRDYGVTATYFILAGIAGIAAIASLFIIDHPPGSPATCGPKMLNIGHGVQVPAGGATIPMSTLLKSPILWALAFAFVANAVGAVTLLTSMVPLGRSWGFAPAQAAVLLSVQSVAGLAGTLLSGWVGDRLGGARTLTILLVSLGVLWALLLVHPAFSMAAVLIGLIGMLTSGVVPVTGLAFAQAFDQRNFSRAYGLINLINLPFTVLCVPAVSYVYTHTGSYTGAIIGMVVLFAVTCLLPLAASKGRKAKTGIPPVISNTEPTEILP